MLQLAQGNKTVISVTRNPEIIKASDFIFHFKDGKVETKTYSKLMETMMESSSVEKNLINFESGETDMRNCHGSMREREHIGLDPNEMVSNGITMSSLPSLNKALLASRKNQEVVTHFVLGKGEGALKNWTNFKILNFFLVC